MNNTHSVTLTVPGAPTTLEHDIAHHNGEGTHLRTPAMMLSEVPRPPNPTTTEHGIVRHNCECNGDKDTRQ